MRSAWRSGATAGGKRIPGTRISSKASPIWPSSPSSGSRNPRTRSTWSPGWTSPHRPLSFPDDDAVDREPGDGHFQPTVRPGPFEPAAVGDPDHGRRALGRLDRQRDVFERRDEVREAVAAVSY